MLDAGCWMLDARYWMLDTGCWILNAGNGRYRVEGKREGLTAHSSGQMFDAGYWIKLGIASC
jgi:hypothetical protein